MQEHPHSQYSHFFLMSNLRAHLYVALEKNAWLQKRIEELEEERNFLRCQLDRFIVSMRSPEGESLHGHVLKASLSLLFILLLCCDRVVCGCPALCEGPACKLSLPSLPHDHQVWDDPQAPAGTSASGPPQHCHPW